MLIALLLLSQAKRQGSPLPNVSCLCLITGQARKTGPHVKPESTVQSALKYNVFQGCSLILLMVYGLFQSANSFSPPYGRIELLI